MAGVVPHLNPVSFGRRLLRWYDQSRRNLPWRRDQEPWRVLVSEIMLQQTRVEAVIPYYERFLRSFPDAAALASASESAVLAAWSGLGYYSRARNLQRAACIVQSGFPSNYEAIRALPGVGPYTAAAVASIAFNLPYAAVDGNVLRVISRVANHAGDIAASVTKERFTIIAGELLNRQRPGDYNQAVMELGATVCLPRAPLCLVCPVSRECLARQEGRQNQLPVKRSKPAASLDTVSVLVARRGASILLRQRASAERRMANFWELPDLSSITLESLPLEQEPVYVAEFRHTIVNTSYTVLVFTARVTVPDPSLQWFSPAELSKIPLTTVSRKALSLCPAAESGSSLPAGGQ